MTVGLDLRLVLREVVARPFRVPPPRRAFVPAMAFAVSDQPVTGHLVGVTDGRDWGWWGPVTRQVAEQAVRLHRTAPRPPRGVPARCVRELRRATRHAHTGLQGVGVGAIELACWDLLGHRHGMPVWRLHRAEPACRSVSTYATCFGVRLDDPAAAAAVREVAAVWPVQKWRPVRGLSVARRAATPAGDGGVALDFGGQWPVDRAMRYAVEFGLALAWIEEPCAPGDVSSLADLPPARRPAPVAAGEHCYNLDDLAALVTAGVEIWQPDAVFCGGYAALLAVSDRAAAADRAVWPHGGGLLPAVHAAIAGAACVRVEHHLLLEPRRQAHLGAPLLPGDDGRLAVPVLPGWCGPLRPDLDG